MKITITGQSAEGKGTVALLIQKTLQEHGIPCHYRDPETTERGQISKLLRLKECLKNLVLSKTEVEIVELHQTSSGQILDLNAQEPEHACSPN